MEQKQQVLIVGLGLLGGSLGLALKGGPWRRLGWARRAETRELALKLDAVDEVGDDLDALLARADLTVLALPVPVIEQYTRPVAAGMVRLNRENRRLMRQKKKEARRLKAAGKKEKDA